MFENTLNPPPQKKPLTTDFFCSNQMKQWITMTADDATMNAIIWFMFFLLKTTLRGF